MPRSADVPIAKFHSLSGNEQNGCAAVSKRVKDCIIFAPWQMFPADNRFRI